RRRAGRAGKRVRYRPRQCTVRSHQIIQFKCRCLVETTRPVGTIVGIGSAPTWNSTQVQSLSAAVGGRAEEPDRLGPPRLATSRSLAATGRIPQLTRLGAAAEEQK